MSKSLIISLFGAFCAALIYWQLSFFVVQPIGAVPQGITLFIVKGGNIDFIDSPDGFCERETGSVNLLCRGAVLGKVVNSSYIIARLPYSEFLYKISTAGRTYSK